MCGRHRRTRFNLRAANCCQAESERQRNECRSFHKKPLPFRYGADMRMSARTAGGTGACLWLYSVCGCSIPYAVNILSAMHCGKRPRRCSRAGHAAQPLCGASKRVTISMVGGLQSKKPQRPRLSPSAGARPSLPTPASARPSPNGFSSKVGLLRPPRALRPPNDPRALVLARFRSVCSIRVHTAAKPPLRKASHGRGRMPRKPQKRNRYPISIALPAAPGATS